MTDTPHDLLGDSIPKPPEWYRQLPPFDPSQVAFRDSDGREFRYMTAALDERYLIDPDGPGTSDGIEGAVAAGTIPPEELEVRHTLALVGVHRSRLSGLEHWWSRTVHPTAQFITYRDALRRVKYLAQRSAEHRAALCRLSHSEHIVEWLRDELREIVTASGIESP